MSIIFLTKYSKNGASSRYRSLQYLPKLEAAGINCTVYSLLDDLYLEKRYERGYGSISGIVAAFWRRVAVLFKVNRYNFLWLEYEIFPYFPAIIEDFLSNLGIHYVVDYDDAIFHKYDQHNNELVRFFLGKKIAKVMRNANLVITGNKYLSDYAHQAGSSFIEILPTVVDLNRYTLTLRPKNSVFNIGWIGSPSTTKYLNTIAPALAEICKNGQGQLVLIGAEDIDIPGVPITKLPWTENTEVANMQKLDVGIMPLTDDPWERGKCGFKLIQYMACGLPVVASPVGVNSEIVDQGINGFLATTIQDWVVALNVLRDSPSLREQMGKAGRQKVESEYCLEVTAPRLISFLYNLYKKKHEK